MATITREFAEKKYVVRIEGYKLNSKEMLLLNDYDKLYGEMLDKKKTADDKMEEIFGSIKSRAKLFSPQ